MKSVPGTQGYNNDVSSFVHASQSLDFRKVCKDFVDFLPIPPARILDAGAGAGQNSAALAEMGYSVIAVEPMEPFLAAARNLHPHTQITWLQDSLPLLQNLVAEEGQFDFILAEGVWHHLTEEERKYALNRFACLLNPGGKCALSLRNGPAGLGTHVFPIDVDSTVRQAHTSGMECIFRVENQPSILPNKKDVTWARIVLQK